MSAALQRCEPFSAALHELRTLAASIAADATTARTRGINFVLSATDAQDLAGMFSAIAATLGEHRTDTGIPASTVPGNPGVDALTPDHLAEHAGAVIGLELLNTVMRAKSQAEAVRLIRDAVLDVDHPAAAAGFAVQLVDVVQRGLRNLPKLDAEDAA
jgi:hypothetical protein